MSWKRSQWQPIALLMMACVEERVYRLGSLRSDGSLAIQYSAPDTATAAAGQMPNDVVAGGRNDPESAGSACRWEAFSMGGDRRHCNNIYYLYDLLSLLASTVRPMSGERTGDYTEQQNSRTPDAPYRNSPFLIRTAARGCFIRSFQPLQMLMLRRFGNFTRQPDRLTAIK